MDLSISKRLLCLAAALTVLSGCALTNGGSHKSESGASSGVSEGGESGNTDNEEAEAEFVLNDSKVEFSKPGGVYQEAFSLELKCDGGKLYYTTDGSDPRTSDTRIEYSGAVEITDRSGAANVVSAVDPLSISGNFNDYNRRSESFTCKISAPSDDAVDKCTVIRAAAQAEDGSFSQTASCTYFIGSAESHIQGLKESCEASGQDLAVISITMDYDDLFDAEKGIYVKGNIFDKALQEKIASGEKIDGETARALDANYKQKGREWEKLCNIDYMEFNADGGETKFSQDAGIRIQGNYSRSDLQKGFRLYARNSYGENNFNYPVFGDNAVNEKGETLNKYKTLVLRAGGNCAFTAKFNDTYWQDMSKELDCSTKASRPCVVYLNGEYWGLYILEENYSDDYFEDHYGVAKENVVVYKGDAEALKLGYKLDEGTLPEGENNEKYYFKELLDFFRKHKDLSDEADYEEFEKLVDVESARDYFLAEIWINNKWDWPGKNWSMWKTADPQNATEYDDGRWRFMFYDMEFGGVSGEQDAYTNTVKEDNYKPLGLLDMGTNNPAVLTYAYLMTNEEFRNDFNSRLLAMSEDIYEKDKALEKLNHYIDVYEPLYEQFFKRYPQTGSPSEAVDGGYASAKCIKDFLDKRADNIQDMVDWINEQF